MNLETLKSALFPADHPLPCPAGASCPQAVVRVTLNGGAPGTFTTRYYITAGHAGFNLPANNGRGYGLERHARRAAARSEAAGQCSMCGSRTVPECKADPCSGRRLAGGGR